MSIYRFGKPSTIETIDFRRSGGGGLRGYISVDADIEPAKVDAIKRALTHADMQWTPITDNGKPALEVRGLNRGEGQLLSMMRHHGFAAGATKREAVKEDKVSWWEWFKKNTLRLSGIAYLAGDIGFLSYGKNEAFVDGKLVKPQMLFSGIFYALGTPFITLFGQGDKSDLQFRHMCYNALAAFEEQGVPVPKDAAIRAVAQGHNEGIVKKVLNFCRRYPAEIANSMFGVAGSFLVFANVKDLFTKLTGGRVAHSTPSIISDIGLGSMTMLAGAISVFVEEEVPGPNEPKKTGMARAWQFLKEKPLRAAGAALMTSTVCHAYSTFDDWRHSSAIVKANVPGQKLDDAKELLDNLPGRAAFVLSGFTAEALMSISSKGHGAGVISDKSLDRSMFGVMADLIARTEPHKKEEMLERVSVFLANKKHLGGEKTAITKGIQEELGALEEKENPWTKVIPAQPRIQMDVVAKRPTKSWLEKTIVPAAAVEVSAAL